MSAFLFLLRELLGAMRVRSAVLLSLAVAALFLFLACFAALFLLPEVAGPTQGGLGATDIVAYVSPRLSQESINSLFLRLQERSDVQNIGYRLPAQVTSERTSGSFLIATRTVGSVPGLVAALRATEGISSVEARTAANGFALTRSARLGLLCALVVCALVALILAREGFRALLTTFRHEIRLMRLSGVSEGRILASVEVTGLLMGLLAGVLLIVGLALYATSAGSSAAESARIVTVGAVAAVLGLLLGGLFGLLGAAHLASNRFAPLS